MEKILSKISVEVNVPKKIYIGDPMYFEQMEGKELERLTYSKNYRGKKDWIGRLVIVEAENSFELKGKKEFYTDIYFKLCFAPNQELLDTYSEDSYYKYQKLKNTKIGVDSASYIIGYNDREINVYTMSDGHFGNVLELYNGSKLEGIMVDMSFGEYDDIENIKQDLSYLFNVKFE